MGLAASRLVGSLGCASLRGPRMSVPVRIAVISAALVAQACATTYQATGLVLRVEPAASTLTVSHDAVAGLMDAMVMPVTIRDGSAMKGIRPGDRVQFRLVVAKRATHADRLRLLSAAPADQGLVMTPATSTLAPIGGSVPDFSLIDQRGAVVTLGGLRGRVIVVTFIYTRCPLPDYCPRMVTNLAAVRDRFRSKLGDDLTLLTVTFDPQYDTPERLAAYARRHNADIPGWHFLTGDADGIRQVCEAFGVEYWPDSGLITHTLQTAVVDREGRLAAAVEGKDVTGRQIADLVQSVLEQ
jgi:protein SCO1/2